MKTVPASDVDIQCLRNIAQRALMESVDAPDEAKTGILADVSCAELSARDTIRVSSSRNAVGFYAAMGFRIITPDQPVPDWVVPMEFSAARRLPSIAS